MAAAPSSTLTDLAAALENGGAGRVPGDETEMIRYADELITLSGLRLDALVVEARSRGVSWQSIGDALGVSRQAAFKRFAGAIERSPDGATQSIDLIDRTVSVFEALSAGNDDAVRGLMTYTCARALTKRKLQAVWNEVTSLSGELERCTGTTVRTADGRTVIEKFANRHLLTGAVVHTSLQHVDGEWVGRVAYNSAGKITGILIAPPGSENLPF